MMADLKGADFIDLVGRDVMVGTAEHGAVPMTITEATKTSKQPAIESYSVLFQGPAEPFLSQQIHQVDLGERGTHSIFMVPIGQPAGGYLYEAVFTSVVDKD